MNDNQAPATGSPSAEEPAGSARPSVDPRRGPASVADSDTAGRDGSPDRGGRPADGSNAGEEFGSGFGGYQGGNQADARGGDAGGLPDPGHAGAGLPADREQGTKPPDRA